MSKKSTLDPAVKKKSPDPAPTKAKGRRKPAQDDDERPRRPMIQVVGGAIVAVAVAVSMLVSVITPFFF